MYVGLGYSLVARNVENQTDRKELLGKAEHHYKVAIELDSNDHLAEYYMALHFAETKRPQEGLKSIDRAIELNPDHLASIQLNAMLLSGKLSFIYKVGNFTGKYLIRSEEIHRGP